MIGVIFASLIVITLLLLISLGLVGILILIEKQRQNVIPFREENMEDLVKKVEEKFLNAILDMQEVIGLAGLASAYLDFTRAVQTIQYVEFAKRQGGEVRHNVQV
ncbi:MAG: hypothetical protein IMZ43_09930 [Thermoplasmata archaeon]|nr:hypothetical protein [Thermoplasmata archaeon]